MRFLAPLDRGLHLRRVPLFGDLPANRVALLVEYTTEEVIPAGTVFQTRGAAVHTVRVIVEGNVSCELEDGKAYRLGPDSVVGVFELFAGLATATLRAEGEVIAIAIPATAIRRILEEYFDVVVHVFRGLGRTLIRSLVRVPTMAGSADPPTLPPHGEHPDLTEVDVILALRGTLAFQNASVGGLSALAQRMSVETFEQGDVLWTQSDAASWLGIVVHGIVECEIMPSGTRFYFSENGPSAVGFLDTLGDDNRWYQATALTDVVLLKILKDDLLDTLEDRFEMALACLGAFATFSIAVVGRLRDAPGLPPNEGLPSSPLLWR